LTANLIRISVVAERLGWIREMVDAIRRLPLASYQEFSQDARNAGAAESYLRRALEALLDLGRHILAKGFAEAVVEYREIAVKLKDRKVLPGEEAELVRKMAGYRNRLVHFYHEVSHRELYSLCTNNLADIERVADALTAWLREHPEKLDARI